MIDYAEADNEPNQRSGADVALGAGSARDERPLAAATRLARTLAGAARASLLLPESDTGSLYVAATSGLPASVFANVRVRLGEPIAGLVAQSRQPQIVNELRATHPTYAAAYRTGSYICMPVPLDGDRTGVLNVADPVDHPSFRPADLATLQDLVGFVARDLASAARHDAHRQELIEVREDERRRVARELHDDVGDVLTAAIFRLDLDTRRLAGDPAAAPVAIQRARAALQECAAFLHDVTYALRPRTLDDLGLLAALRILAARTHESGLRVILAVEGQRQPLDEATDLAVFRVVQEALTNVRKHAQATHAWVWLQFEPGQLAVVVEDDGRGLGDLPGPAGRGTVGLGLRGMRERVELLGGSLTVGPRPRKGTRLVARLPLDAGRG